MNNNAPNRNQQQQQRYEANTQHEQVDFKRIICIPIGKNKHAAISLANSKIFSLTQFVVVEFDDQKVNRFAIPGSIRLTKKSLLSLHKMLSFVIVRLTDNADERLNENQLSYIERMKKFWTNELDDEVAYEETVAGYDESSYGGETYDNFNMPIENIRRK